MHRKEQHPDFVHFIEHGELPAVPKKRGKVSKPSPAPALFDPLEFEDEHPLVSAPLKAYNAALEHGQSSKAEELFALVIKAREQVRKERSSDPKAQLAAGLAVPVGSLRRVLSRTHGLFGDSLLAGLNRFAKALCPDLPSREINKVALDHRESMLKLFGDPDFILREITTDAGN